MPLDVVRLRDSGLTAKASGDEFRAAVLLWCASWHQVPAASLPDDNRQLAKFAGYGKVVREFDLVTKAFVKDGFTLPEAKSDVAWAGTDELFVGTDFGPDSLTESGYPRIVKRWRRGEPLDRVMGK